MKKIAARLQNIILAALLLSLAGGLYSATAEDEEKLPDTVFEAGLGEVNREHALIYQSGEQPAAEEPIDLKKGPHLFLDDYLIAKSENVDRVVNQPKRDPDIPNPVVTGKEDGCFQPYMSIIRDPESKKFHIWYGSRTEDSNSMRSRIGYMESDDGIHWERPHRILDGPGPIQFGVAVIDEGPDFKDPEKRFKYAYHMDNGLKIATSPDGLHWTPLVDHPVILHSHDINGLIFDPIRKRYLATLSVYREGDLWEGRRRITTHSYSDDLIHWDPSRFVVLPHPEYDSGETQFYAMDGYLARGDLLIGMVKVLRDDLKADNPPDPPEAYGVGYTSLAWTRDGKTWVRDTEHFFDPNPTKGEWDHAHAWIDEQVPVNGEVYLYYGGYKSGHKVNRFEERQIGLVTMKRDRYVAREAGDEGGALETPKVKISGDRVTLNVDAEGGEVRVAVLDENGEPIDGFDYDDCQPISEDALEAPVEWKKDLSSLGDRIVSLGFKMKNAKLYAMNVE
ncbi:MAG: hypothetical protein H6752_21570 [Candidatus Omnitrophica bacterium]|nr:hypothetical protein [Candidatus Omnitrophota bacterium]